MNSQKIKEYIEYLRLYYDKQTIYTILKELNQKQLLDNSFVSDINKTIGANFIKNDGEYSIDYDYEISEKQLDLVVDNPEENKTPINILNISPRAFHVLENNNIIYLEDLEEITEYELLSFNNLGDVTLREIKALMKTNGLRFKNQNNSERVDPRVDKIEDNSSLEYLILNERIVPLETLQLSNRTYRSLKKQGIESLQELSEYSEFQLMKIRGFGRNCYLEVIEIIELYKNLMEKKNSSSIIEEWDGGIDEDDENATEEVDYLDLLDFYEDIGK